MTAAVESMAYVGEPPWHRFGAIVEGNLSPREMQFAAGLNWDVEKVPLQFEYKQRTQKTDQFALIRTADGTVLDIIKSDNWAPVQNEEAFEFFDRFVKHNGMTMEVAGSLRDGKFVFVLAKMNKSFDVGPGGEDRTDGYVLFTNPHQYGHAVDIRLTPIRVVCMNTLSIALKTESNVNVKYSHWHSFDVEAAQSVFAELLSSFGDYADTAGFLAAKSYDDQSLQQYFDKCFPYVPNMHSKNPPIDRSSANANRAFDIVETQPGADLSPGSWWNAVNAVTFLTDHELGKSAETRLHSAWYGKGDRRKRHALKLGIEYAKAA